ncbi:hypothetical protein QYE76_007100 [Lolium multiflorum]|uniref:Replication protein A C-terminal domain-containing protein n=1 Tax=Lolium multiflorum TaxID=4521 RepID=A0AAD8RWX8_LOLMU|nr:hypothetical protein QYE76_007100 [Lolium multiflorum]
MMFSSQTGAFSPSQLTPSSTTPLTVKQIAAAQLTGPDEEGVPFVVDGVDTSKITVVGMVSGKAETGTDVTFTLDDGTGRIDFIRWVNDAADSSETAAIQNGMYVSVIGTLKGLQDKKRATAFCVRPVTDDNEVPLHFTQCVQMHMENTKTMSQLAIGTNGSGTDLYTQVLNVLSEPASIESDHGVHIDEIAKRLRLPESKIVDAINFHLDSGHIFSTIDDFHYKSAYID